MTSNSPNTSSARIALVTGGSRGLGKSAAVHLARDGWDLVITYLNRADAAAATVAEIQAMGRKAVALPLDTGFVASFGPFVEAFTKALKETFGSHSFGALVNNAGNSSNGEHSLIHRIPVRSYPEREHCHPQLLQQCHASRDSCDS
jgi:NAD(P)-dependent dehydrogenase (short-subunit alcohol dehydrogenase family)